MNESIYLKIQRVVNTCRFGYAIQVLPSDKTITSKHKIILNLTATKNYSIAFLYINVVLKNCMTYLWHHFCHLILYFLYKLCQLNLACPFLSFLSQINKYLPINWIRAFALAKFVFFNFNIVKRYNFHTHVIYGNNLFIYMFYLYNSPLF